MGPFLVIIICMIAGQLCKRAPQFPASTSQSLNSFIIFLSLPALVLSQIPKLLATPLFSGAWWIPVSMAWLMFALSFGVFSFLGRKLRWSRPKTGALILTAGLGNTSFVGFPLLEALIGHQALPVGILIDQTGSFLILSTLGILVAATFSGESVAKGSILRKVAMFPPLIALFVSVFWSLAGCPGGELLFPLFDKVAATLVPLALFAVGFQLRFKGPVLKKRWMPLTLGLGMKLVLAPALFAFFYLKLLGGNGLATQVTVLESAMAPMISAAVVASEFHLDSELANLMVGIGIPLSIVTVPLWSLLFKT
jgi:hypothetical protein